jgi:RNA polymerase sigma factor (sigma-70 family)
MSATKDQNTDRQGSSRRLRRVVIEEPTAIEHESLIEERQRRTLEHARMTAGYAEDVDPHAYGKTTFRLINERMALDSLPGSDYIVPALDEWKHWNKMSDWDARNRKLEDLVSRLRRKEISDAEIQFLVIVCRPTWLAVARNLRRYGGADLDPRADGMRLREEASRVNMLDRGELNEVVQRALLDALWACPRPFPRRFFPWLRNVLAYRALDHIRTELGENEVKLPKEVEIEQVIDQALASSKERGGAFFAEPASPGHDQWIRTLDISAIFELADEYSSYARTGSACERAVRRLPRRQQQVIQSHYFENQTQAEIAAAHRLADSTVRNTHRGALRALGRDDDLFDVLEAVGKVRDQTRRAALDARRAA